MRKANQFQYSVVQYRRDPTEPDDNSVVLGFAVEFATSDYWVVALGMRATLAEDELQRLDPLTRDLLQDPSDLLKGEIISALRGVQKPGDVLRRFAANNPWSIHVSPPKSAQLPRGKSTHEASVQRLSDEYLLHAFVTELRPQETLKLEPAVKRKRGAPRVPQHEPAFDEAASDLRSTTPPMWMVRHQFEVPILH